VIGTRRTAALLALEKFRSVWIIDTHVLLALALILALIVLLAGDADRHGTSLPDPQRISSAAARRADRSRDYGDGGGLDLWHRFVPITPSGWTPSQPVRFLVDGDAASGRGLLLRGQLPGFVRIGLERKGLRIAGD
jgi:hypothetical protein